MAGMKQSRRIAWEVRRLAHRLGWGTLLGAALLVLAVAAAWQGQHLAQRQQQLARELRAAQQAAGKPQTPQRDNAADAADQIAMFYAYLPRHAMIPDQLKQLVAIADRNGITLAKADYKAQPEENADFLRYQIGLPIKADYARVQAFIFAALHGLPALTLDSVTFKRTVAAAEVEARVQFILLVRKSATRGSK